MANNPFAGVREYIIYGNDVTLIVTITGQQTHRTSDLLAHPNVTAGFTRAVTSAQEEGGLPSYDIQRNLQSQPGAMPQPDIQGNRWTQEGFKINS
jgi:hypothetical protein